VNSLPKTVTRQRRGCDLNPGLSVPESSMVTTRLSSHHNLSHKPITVTKFSRLNSVTRTYVSGSEVSVGGGLGDRSTAVRSLR